MPVISMVSSDSSVLEIRSRPIKRIFLATQAQFEAEKTNLGERTIFINMVKQLKKQIPNLEITVLSSNPSYTIKTYNINAIPLNGLRAIWLTLKQIMKTDLLIVGGGELIQDKSSLVMIPYMLMRPFIAKILHKKVMGYAIGVGEDEEISRFGKLITRFVVNKFDLITVRDPKSKIMLYKLGVRKPKIFEAVDAAISLIGAPAEKIKEILKYEGLTDYNRPLVAFSTRSVYHRTHHLIPFSYRKKYKLMPKQYYVRIKEFKEKMAKAADYVIEKYGVKVIFVPAYIGPRLSAYDDEFSDEIRELMKYRKDSILLKGIYFPEEIKGVLSQVQMLIGVPLHSLILAGSSNIPLIDINYASKGRCYMELIGQSKYIINAANITDKFELDKLIKYIDEVWERKKEIRRELREKNQALLRKASLSAQLAARLLEEDR